AKEIVQRGHKAARDVQTWIAQFSMTHKEERVSYQQSIDSIQRATGTRPLGPYHSLKVAQTHTF
ncbi:MAG TPA: hypothetical protein VMU57_18645, partial [Edaphobacter sp.]|nr:hypothetical protein [Edaphobacter sp.]